MSCPCPHAHLSRPPGAHSVTAPHSRGEAHANPRTWRSPAMTLTRAGSRPTSVPRPRHCAVCRAGRALLTCSVQPPPLLTPQSPPCVGPAAPALQRTVRFSEPWVPQRLFGALTPGPVSEDPYEGPVTSPFPGGISPHTTPGAGEPKVPGSATPHRRSPRSCLDPS